MIISGGQNDYPSDIEAVVLEHPDVVAVSVIGVPSLQWGETPLAVVEPMLSAQRCEAIREWVNSRVGRYQRLAQVFSIASLPRNPNGKVLKHELANQVVGGERD